jgi:1,4-dihydroxy-2-naphthoate octaprenyltransferase
MTSGVLTWVRAFRPLAHGNIAPPILLGQAFAACAGHPIDPGSVVLAHAFGLVDHAYIVFSNDLADHATDRDNDTHTPLSGGSRVVPDGLHTLASLRRAAIGAAVGLLVLTTLAAALAARPLAPLFAVAALVLLWAYSHPPLRLSYRGGGELLQGLGVGAVLPLWGFYAQVGSLESFPWLALAPLVLLHTIGNVITALPDTPSDTRADKRSWPVRVGERVARVHAVLGLALALLGIGLLESTWSSPTRALAVVALPFLSLAGSLVWIREADARSRAACLRFVLGTAGALGLVQLAWALAHLV